LNLIIVLTILIIGYVVFRRTNYYKEKSKEFINKKYKKSLNISRFILFLIGAMFFVYYVALIPMQGVRSANLISLLAAIFFIIYALEFSRFLAFTQVGIRRILRYLVYLSFVFFIAVMGLIIYFAHTNTVTYKEDAVIVLGSGVNGKQIGEPFLTRLNSSIMYHNKNSRALIVVSGGQGPGEDISEAQAGADYLEQNGIPTSQILLEDKSVSTFQNFSFSKLILDKKLGKNYTVAFITNPYHIFRATEIAQKLGMHATYVSAPYYPRYLVPLTYIREFLAVMKFWIFSK
jgi:uncharacterized SAM-binding protein YcdF (DUF218 family)